MNDPRPRVRVVTLGCKVNQADSDAIAEAIKSVGSVLTAGDDAAIVVVNTCTVTAEADRKARKAIRHVLALPARPSVVVTGCLAATDPAGLRALGDGVVVEADKEGVAARVFEVSRTRGQGRTSSASPGAGHGKGTGPSAARQVRARVQVKVQDGCDASCAYCIVPAARGHSRSVPLDAVVSTVVGLAEAGVAEVVLTGVNIGRYDHAGRRLPDLLRAVAATGVPRVRISSIEPGDVDEALLAVAVSLPSFCPHLHIPLQSGCDRTLHAMGRPYDVRTFGAVLASAKRALPGVAVTTDMVVGFPGESEADACESLAFAEHAGFSRLHVFRYSARPGTQAAGLPGQVPAARRSARARAMRDLGAALAERFAQERIGTACEMLVERESRVDGVRYVEGTTREYLRAVAKANGAKVGDLIRVDITGVGAGGRVTAQPAH